MWLFFLLFFSLVWFKLRYTFSYQDFLTKVLVLCRYLGVFLWVIPNVTSIYHTSQKFRLKWVCLLVSFKLTGLSYRQVHSVFSFFLWQPTPDVTASITFTSLKAYARLGNLVLSELFYPKWNIGSIATICLHYPHASNIPLIHFTVKVNQ